MHEPLFLDRPLTFEKIAGPMTRLSDDAQKWEQEISQEAYRQLPYLSDFEIHVALDRVDEERGYAFGSIEVSPKSQMTYEERQDRPISKAHIPVIVRDQMMCPLDVFIYSDKYHPLTETRLRSTLFRPDTFDAARMRPPEPSIYYDLQPPLGDGRIGGGGIKLSHVKLATPILPQLHGRVLARHIDRVKTALLDPSFGAAMRNAPEGVQAAFHSAVQMTPSSAEKTAEASVLALKPNVVQLVKQANGRYLVKWANSDAYAPQHEMVDQAEAHRLLDSPDMIARTEADGTVTVSPDAAVKSTLSTPTDVKAADQFGIWSVQDTMGNELIGWVFPQVMSFDMQPLPLTLFTNGSQYGLQETIAGKLLGKATDMPRSVPRGYGCFYYLDHGNARAFVPMTVGNSFRRPDGSTGYQGNLDTGEQIVLHFAPELKAVTKVAEGEYVIPESLSWLPLKASVELVPDASLFMKTAQREWKHTVELVGDGSTWSFRGPAVAKLAHDQKSFLNRDQTAFIGTALGIDPSFMKEAMAKTASGERPAIFEKVRCIIPLAEKLAEAKTKVAGMLKELDVKNFDLIKEASVLDDALTVDKVLSLGFLNAENVGTFVDMLPGLEQAASRISEMLVASRLGMRDVPEVALARMMKALDDVILGLRRLKAKELGFLR